MEIESAVASASRIAAGELTATELMEACLGRIAARESIVGAWEFLDPERALATANRLDGDARRRGPLHGIPIGVKDAIDTAELPTCYGSALYSGHRPLRDAACVALAKDAGAVVAGKTVTAEFAYFAPGKTANPWDPTRTPGGSSSGSAAAVADGMVPLALGIQTSGSVIRPAAFCGVIGFKPTFGVINRAGVWPFAESLDTVGVFARTVEDVSLLVAVVAGRSHSDRTDESKRCFGLYRTHLWDRAEEHSKTAVNSAGEQLANAGADVDEIHDVPELSGIEDVQARIMAYEAARSFAHERRTYSDDALSPQLADLLRTGDSVDDSQYELDQEAARKGRRALRAAFARFDAVLTPSTIGEAPKGLDATGDPIFNRAWTVLHGPALHLPTGQGPAGLPIGVQLVASPGEDERLLSAAMWAQDRLVDRRRVAGRPDGARHSR